MKEKLMTDEDKTPETEGNCFLDIGTIETLSALIAIYVQK